MIKDMPLIILGGSFLDAFVKLSIVMILFKFHKFYFNKRFLCSFIILGVYTFITYLMTDNALRIFTFYIVFFK